MVDVTVEKSTRNCNEQKKYEEEDICSIQQNQDYSTLPPVWQT
jgi:hypothetical protein